MSQASYPSLVEKLAADSDVHPRLSLRHPSTRKAPVIILVVLTSNTFPLNLRGTDAARAYAASWRLAAAPQEAIRFLEACLRPVPPVAAEQVQSLFADLDSDEFRKREAAAARLRDLDDRVEGFLKKAPKGSPSLEMRRRVEDLLKDLQGAPSGETLRTLRAMEVLERIGTSEARQILKTLAQGVPEARVTREPG